MSNKKFDFELKDTKTADEVLKEYGNRISEWTNGMVWCEVVSYEGATESYTKRSGLTAAAEALVERDITVDIQQYLGEQSEMDNKFEVYLAVRGLEYYKYRIMFIKYGAIAYPVNIVLNEDIAKAYSGKSQYKFFVETMKDLEEMVEQIFETDYCTKLIQSLIYEAMRQEKKNKE